MRFPAQPCFGGRAMLDRTTELPIETENLKICERCGSEFTARQGSGGKPQRFCSTDCRQAFHATARTAGMCDPADDLDSQRSQRAPTCSGSALVPAVIPRPESENAPAGNSEDFDWNDSPSVVLKEQPATAIYWNARGDLVIRQQGWPDDDSVILISENNAQAFLDKLCDAMGIPGFP